MMKLDWPNVFITAHENAPTCKLSFAMLDVVKGKNIANMKLFGLFGLSEAMPRESISSAEELAMYEMAWKAKEKRCNFVTCFQYKYILINPKTASGHCTGAGMLWNADSTA